MTGLPTTRDIRHARRRTEATVKQASAPLMAALGAVDTVAKAVTDVMTRARTEAGDRAQGNRDRLQKALGDLQGRVSDLPAELGDLRNRIDRGELRQLADEYNEVAQKAYNDLVRRGTDVFGEFRTQPQVARTVDSMGSSVDAAQRRLEAVVADVNAVAEDLSVRFARGSRSAGERTARATENATGRLADQVKATGDEVAGAISEAGGDAAASTRSGTRQAASRTSTQRRSTSRTGGRTGTSSTGNRGGTSGRSSKS